jgi:hypothetical protein
MLLWRVSRPRRETRTTGSVMSRAAPAVLDDRPRPGRAKHAAARPSRSCAASTSTSSRQVLHRASAAAFSAPPPGDRPGGVRQPVAGTDRPARSGVRQPMLQQMYFWRPGKARRTEVRAEGHAERGNAPEQDDNDPSSAHGAEAARGRWPDGPGHHPRRALRGPAPTKSSARILCPIDPGLGADLSTKIRPSPGRRTFGTSERPREPSRASPQLRAGARPSEPRPGRVGRRSRPVSRIGPCVPHPCHRVRSTMVVGGFHRHADLQVAAPTTPSAQSSKLATRVRFPSPAPPHLCRSRACEWTIPPP